MYTRLHNPPMQWTEPAGKIPLVRQVARPDSATDRHYVMPAMKASELDRRLREEGCNPSTYSVLGSSHDAWCLNFRDGKWVIFYSERGVD